MVKEIQYKVVKRLDKVEIRHYNKLIIAKVEGYGDNGFNFLFNYISGDNTAENSVEMTAPVLSEKDWIAFVIPEEYTLSTTPKPKDDRIKIQQIPERYVATLRFTGRYKPSNFEEKAEQLLKELKKENIETRGKVFVMRYSSPFKPWFLRRNEVATEVDFP